MSLSLAQAKHELDVIDALIFSKRIEMGLSSDAYWLFFLTDEQKAYRADLVEQIAKSSGWAEL